MAPVNGGDIINITAMVGTWLGTIFTAVGLIAVFSQLRLVWFRFTAVKEQSSRQVYRKVGGLDPSNRHAPTRLS